MDETALSKLTKQRLAALEHIVGQVAANGALLLLTEKQEDTILILPSYVAGSFKSLSPQLENQAIRVKAEYFDTLNADQLGRLVKEQIAGNGWLAVGAGTIVCEAVFGESPVKDQTQTKPFPIAFLAFQGGPIDQSSMNRYLFWIGSIIRTSRDERFKDAILKLHAVISKAAETQESLTGTLAELLRGTIGPCEVKKIRRTGLTAQNDLMESDPSATWPGRTYEFDHHLLSNVDTALLQSNSLHVPHSEMVYQLASRPFGAPEDIKASLPSLTHYTSAFLLTKKHVEGYLQSHFSASDQDTSTVIVDMAQSLADQNDPTEDLNLVQDINDPGETVDAPALQTELDALLGEELKSVTVIDINQNGDEIELSPHTSWPGELVSEDYGDRLLTFAKTFYLNGLSAKFDQMQVGIDLTNKHRCMEFHFPSSFGHGKLVLLSFESSFVSARHIDKLFHMLRVHFHKMKRLEMLAARSRILIETRHSVIHYVHLVANGLKTLKRQWDLSTRNEQNWIALRKNKIFVDILENINWATHQSTLILQSGRYIYDEIDNQSIRRISSDIEKVIQDCKQALDFETKRKSLIWRQKIEGFRPSHIYFDPILLQIALLNLFDNAVKYAPNGTEVRWVLSYGKESYRLSISNRGDQILAGKLDLLLKFGFRGRQRDQLNTRSGTGLGLPVANRILTAHAPAAKLELTSSGETGFGSVENTFSFVMPYLTGIEHRFDEAKVRGPDGT